MLIVVDFTDRRGCQYLSAKPFTQLTGEALIFKRPLGEHLTFGIEHTCKSNAFTFQHAVECLMGFVCVVKHDGGFNGVGQRTCNETQVVVDVHPQCHNPR